MILPVGLPNLSVVSRIKMTKTGIFINSVKSKINPSMIYPKILRIIAIINSLLKKDINCSIPEVNRPLPNNLNFKIKYSSLNLSKSPSSKPLFKFNSRKVMKVSGALLLLASTAPKKIKKTLNHQKSTAKSTVIKKIHNKSNISLMK